MTDERDRLHKDFHVQKSYLDESMMRNDQLEHGMNELKMLMDDSTMHYSNTLMSLSKDHEHVMYIERYTDASSFQSLNTSFIH